MEDLELELLEAKYSWPLNILGFRGADTTPFSAHWKTHIWLLILQKLSCSLVPMGALVQEYQNKKMLKFLT